MPCLKARTLFASSDLVLRRVSCDGVDAPNAADERFEDDRIVLVLRGRFTFEARRVRAVASPMVGLFVRAGEPFRIRHPEGQGDVCVSVRGGMCAPLVASGPSARRIDEPCYLRVRDLAVRAVSGMPLHRLAVEEVLCAVLSPRATPQRALKPRDRDIAHGIAYRIERDLHSRLSLPSLTRDAGVSIFHACRAFRRFVGTSIHRYHQEVRLRHALALLLETDRPIADIAADLGFANQGHLTNLFRRRFGTTPGAARKRLTARAGAFVEVA